MDIRWLQEDELPRLMAFFAEHLRPDSILATEEPFLRWMFYEAPGWQRDGQLSVAGAFEADELTGLLGMVVVPRGGQVCAWLTNWLVQPGRRGGLALLSFARQQEFDLIAALGVNEHAASIYRALRWQPLPPCRRYLFRRADLASVTPTGKSLPAGLNQFLDEDFLAWRYAPEAGFPYEHRSLSGGRDQISWRRVPIPGTSEHVARVSHLAARETSIVCELLHEPFADETVRLIDLPVSNAPNDSAPAPVEVDPLEEACLVPFFQGYAAPGQVPDFPISCGDADRDRPR